MVAAFAVACASSQADVQDCSPMRASGNWTLSMMADESDYRLAGVVRFWGDTAVAELVATTNEGTGELVEAPIENLNLVRDSSFFSFAPIRFHLQGRCLSPDRLEGTFSVPQPPFGDIVGRWSMVKER
jgi:hypothetical protein